MGNSGEDIYKANSNMIKNDLYKKIYMACQPSYHYSLGEIVKNDMII